MKYLAYEFYDYLIDKLIHLCLYESSLRLKSRGSINPRRGSMFGKKNIVDIAVADGRFKTLVSALQAADLVGTLKGKGPFTVLAPTDDAFNKLPPGTIEGLLKDTPKLKNILLYHVIAAKAMSRDVMKMTSADTVLGKPVRIQVKAGKVVINESQVIAADIEASNGVIHVIDTVLLPG